MNYSEIFRAAHNQAKEMMKTGLYASYRGAFSVALSAVLREEWAVIRAEKISEQYAESSKTFRELPILGGRVIGHVKLNGCDKVRAVYANERTFYVDGDQYDFECDTISNLKSFIENQTGGLLEQPKPKAVKKYQPKNLTPVKSVSPIKKEEIKKPVSMPTQKRAASGRGFGRKVANVRRLGLAAMIDTEQTREVTFH